MKILLTTCIKCLRIFILRFIPNFVYFIVECDCVKSQNSEQSNGEKIRMNLVIPLVILVLCFVLSLGANIYQRRLIQIKNRQLCHKYEASEKAERKKEFGTYLIFHLS